MTKKIQLHIDALLVIVLIFLVSFGTNLYQRYQYSDLLKDYVEAETKAQDMEVNWNYVKGLLQNCRKNQTQSLSLDEDPADTAVHTHP